MGKIIALSLCVLLTHVAHADERPNGRPVLHPIERRAGMGLLVASGVCLALGFGFLGAAKNANDSVLAGMQYHPDQEDRRDRFQSAQTAMFLLSGATAVLGVTFVLD